MSAESLTKIKHLLYTFDRPSLNDLSTFVTMCYYQYPLTALTCIRMLLARPGNPPIQTIINSGVVPVIFCLLHKNEYNFGMMFSGYVRELDFDYEIPSVIVECIAQACKLYSVDERIQVECRWILCNIASGDMFVLLAKSEISSLKHTGSKEQTQYVVDQGLVPVLVNGLKETASLAIKSNSVSALGNIMGNGILCRDLVLEKGCFRYFIL